MAGYSGTPLATKLGLKPGCTVAVVAGPKDYPRLIAPMPDSVKLRKRILSATDIVHVFATRRPELERFLAACRARLKPEAVVWVSWPKKSAKMTTDITEDVIRHIALPLGFVDVKVCAVTEVWSGLKLVVRKELRQR